MKETLKSCFQAMLGGNRNIAARELPYIYKAPEDRGNRLCVSVSDIHLTDGTVGIQNLRDSVWGEFYNSLKQRCTTYFIDELVFIMDGDIVDIIRSGHWAEAEIYPWQREQETKFNQAVTKITAAILKKHQRFFRLLRDLAIDLEKDTRAYSLKHKMMTEYKGIKAENVKIVITIGNHDKEMFCVQDALKMFYEEGLGVKLNSIPQSDREAIGEMYGNKSMFADKKTAPYLPFYYGDTGFRLFTTHGQWRDKENSRAISGQNGWSANDGWQIEKWQALKFSPFFEPCFGDTVAAGVLSTFIYQVKKQVKDEAKTDSDIKAIEADLNSIFDELDLYRPTYLALTRILEETKSLGTRKKGGKVVKIIEDTLYKCLMTWLKWPYTLETSPVLRRIGFIITRKILKLTEKYGKGLEIKALTPWLKVLAFFSNHHSKGVSFNEMLKFPGFKPEYRHYDFQLHIEGHTHIPLQEELNLSDKPYSDEHNPNSTYINLGTWRDQIVPRKKTGYRRRGVLRTLTILDLKHYGDEVKASTKEPKRAYDYFVEDVVLWSDFKDDKHHQRKYNSKVT